MKRRLDDAKWFSFSLSMAFEESSKHSFPFHLFLFELLLLVSLPNWNGITLLFSLCLFFSCVLISLHDDFFPSFIEETRQTSTNKCNQEEKHSLQKHQQKIEIDFTEENPKLQVSRSLRSVIPPNELPNLVISISDIQSGCEGSVSLSTSSGLSLAAVVSNWGIQSMKNPTTKGPKRSETWSDSMTENDRRCQRESVSFFREHTYRVHISSNRMIEWRRRGCQDIKSHTHPWSILMSIKDSFLCCIEEREMKLDAQDSLPFFDGSVIRERLLLHQILPASDLFLLSLFPEENHYCIMWYSWSPFYRYYKGERERVHHLFASRRQLWPQDNRTTTSSASWDWSLSSCIFLPLLCGRPINFPMAA